MEAEFPDVGKPTAIKSSEQPGYRAAVGRRPSVPTGIRSGPLPSAVPYRANHDASAEASVAASHAAEGIIRRARASTNGSGKPIRHQTGDVQAR